MGVWLGNPDTRVLTNGNSSIPAKIIGQVMEYAHKDVYAADGKWKADNGGDWYTMPSGIQKISNELYPSWYNKAQAQAGVKMVFDKISKKKAVECTPEGARIEVFVQKITDPITKKETLIAPDGYDTTADDNVHACGDAKPTIGTITATKKGAIQVDVAAGKSPLQTVEIRVGGTVIATLPATASGTFKTTYTPTSKGDQTITVTVTDTLLYTTAKSQIAEFDA
jgi:penicillin-binding protein 1A